MLLMGHINILVMWCVSSYSFGSHALETLVSRIKQAKIGYHYLGDEVWM